MKSSTCFRKDGQPKSVYMNQKDAEYAADYVSQEKNMDFSAYHCTACEGWHICPVERQTPSEPCAYCTGSNGEAKALYTSYEGAQKRAKIISKEQGLHLTVYECHYQSGFHLTKG